MKKLPEVNLLKKELLNSTPGLFVLSWALTVGRWLIIFTELIVISAFVWRLNLDYQSNNLKDQIDEQLVILDIQKPIEKKYREIASQLDTLSQAQNQQKTLINVLQEFSSRMPPSIALNNILWTGYQLSVDGYSQTEDEISVLQNNMQLSDLFTKVTINQVELSDKEKKVQDANYIFKLTAEIK